ncbi:MAG TPA: DedA family protein [Demequinaceae bacterium]
MRVLYGWTLSGFLASLQDQILSLTSSVWIYPSVWAVTVIDGVFPPIPSESIVIAAATTWQQRGVPNVFALWLAAAFGAWCGDQIAYAIGMTIPVRKVPGMRGPRGIAALDWAERALGHRGTSFIIAARFIPVGRVAVNLTAGALRFPRRRFMGIDAVAAAIWATYSIGLGVFAGSLLHDNLLASIGIGVVGGVMLGYLVDLILSKIGVQPPAMVPVEDWPIDGPIALRRPPRTTKPEAPRGPKAPGGAS